MVDAEFGQAFTHALIGIYYWLIVLVNNSLKMWVNDCKLQLKSDKRWKYVWTVFMNTRPTSKKHEFATKKRCLLGPLHWILILLSETNRTQFTKKMWITLFITHPTTKDQKSTGLNLQTRYFCESLYWTPTLLLKTKNQKGCIWIYEYFMSFRTCYPPYFQRRGTQQQLQAQQLFSVSLSLAVH